MSDRLSDFAETSRRYSLPDSAEAAGRDTPTCIQRAGTADWRRLYPSCQDPGVAAIVAAVLPLRDPDLMPSARLWKHLLEDLHPGLHLCIDLRPDDRDVGV